MDPFIPDKLPIEAANYSSADIVRATEKANRAIMSALRLGEQTLSNNRSLSLIILKKLHAILLGTGSVRGKTKNPGNFRKKQNRIGISG